MAAAISQTARHDAVTVTMHRVAKVRPLARLEVRRAWGGSLISRHTNPRHPSTMHCVVKLDKTLTKAHAQQPAFGAPREPAHALASSAWWAKTYRRLRQSTFADDTESSKGFKYVVVEIAYGGGGFDPAHARRVNHDTFTFNPNELHGGGGTGGGTGSGLGLSLAKTIVEAHGGSVWVQSEGVGKGAVFAVGLPISRAKKVRVSLPRLACLEMRRMGG